MRDHPKIEAAPSSTTKPRKVFVMFEDKEGQYLFRQICGSRLSRYISVGNAASFGGDLKNLSTLSTKLPELQNAILVPGGGAAKTCPYPGSDLNSPENLLALPGGRRPETLIYRHLFSMSDSDSFWGSPVATYTRQFAITSKGGISLTTGDVRVWVKKWFSEQSPYWGRSNQKVFKSWVQAHKQDCLIFCKQFIKLLKERYKGDVPKIVTDRILAPFKA